MSSPHNSPDRHIPNEVLNLIVQNVTDTPTLRSLRQCSTTLQEFTTPCLFRFVELPQSLEACKRAVKDLMTEPICRYIRAITVSPDSMVPEEPDYDDLSNRGIDRIDGIRGWRYDFVYTVEPLLKLCEERLEELVYDFWGRRSPSVVNKIMDLLFEKGASTRNGLVLTRDSIQLIAGPELYGDFICACMSATFCLRFPKLRLVKVVGYPGMDFWHGSPEPKNMEASWPDFRRSAPNLKILDCDVVKDLDSLSYRGGALDEIRFAAEGLVENLHLEELNIRRKVTATAEIKLLASRLPPEATPGPSASLRRIELSDLPYLRGIELCSAFREMPNLTFLSLVRLQFRESVYSNQSRWHKVFEVLEDLPLEDMAAEELTYRVEGGKHQKYHGHSEKPISLCSPLKIDKAHFFDLQSTIIERNPKAHGELNCSRWTMCGSAGTPVGSPGSCW